MGRIGVVIDDSLHKALKHYAISQDTTVTDIIVRLIKTELETKKEQTH